MKHIRIAHLYPDVLNLYGDRGNVICLEKRIKDRGIDVFTEKITIGKAFHQNDFDLFFIGGGQDFEQSVLMKDLSRGKDFKIRDAIESGKPFLAICGGYQMLGKYYETHDGRRLDYTGILDFYTKGEKQRLIGNYAFKTKEGIEIVGFENHSGRTYLGKAEPLGRIIRGFGNNGKDKTEGVRYQNTFGTYSHGPVLPKNPRLADLLILAALKNKYGDTSLTELDDRMEDQARQQAVSLYLKK